MVSALALVPPRSSVLPPGAGNEAKKAGKTKPKGAKKAEERYVGQAAVLNGNLHAAAVSGHDHCDVPTIPAVEQAQCDLRTDAERQRPPRR